MASSDSSTPVKDQAESGPVSCAKGCGFFGNPSTGNMCSKCFKESCQAAASAPKDATAPAAVAAPAAAPPTAAAPAPAPTPPAAAEPVEISEPAAPAVPAAPAAPAAAAAASSSSPPPEAEAASADATSPVGAVRPAEETPQEEEPPKKVQANTSRCWTCNRKIGLLGFQCKCEYYFCSEHRYSDRHECAFDYKAQGKQLLTKANPTIAPAKMDSM